MGKVEADRRLAELTAEMAWLQRLARALLKTGDAADLVHDTWLVAHDHAPEDGRPLRPWLSRVALNIVRMQTRSRQRREAREQGAESPAEPVTRPDALIERVELQRHVAGEVLALAEPYRSTVLLHYFEELSCAEIARRLGIPESTVRGRLKVALERLRGRLAPRDSLAPLLAPLAGLGPATHKTAAIAAGVIVMKKIAIAIVLLVLVIATVGWWRDKHDSDTDEHRQGMRTRAAVGATGGGAVDGPNIPTWMTQSGLPARRIAGRVQHGQAPFEGATVRLALVADSGVMQPVAELRSDDAGHFDFGARPAATFAISAEAPRHASVVTTISLADPSAKPDQLVLLIGDCNLRLDGSVLDASGGPIAGARLTSSGLGGTESNARGEYSLCLGNTRPDVRVEAQGYGALEAQLMLNGPLHQDFRLAPEGVVIGQVVTDANEPVARARVMVSPDPIERAQHLASGWAIADEGGVFRVTGLAPGRYRLTASSDGLTSSTPVDAVVRAGSTAFNTIIRVTKTAHVSGRVLMAGEPVVGARVTASRNGEPFGGASYSQRDGSFTLNAVPSGVISLAAWPYDVTSPSSLEVDGRGIDNVVVEVAKTASIRGKVTRHGAPVAGAEVLVPRVLNVKADVDGNYVLEGLAPGQIQLSAGDSTLKAFTRRSVSLKAGEDKTVDLELDRAGEARGVVVDEHGSPVPGAYVKMSSDDGNDFGESTTDAAGAFDCFTLAGGNYAIQVFPSPVASRPFSPAIGERFAPIEVPADGATTGITLAIRDERLEIGGVVVDEAGAAVSDAYVQTVARGRGLFTLPSEMSDASGHFTIGNLAPGDYAIVAHAADGSEGLVTKVAAGTADVEVKVTRPGSVEGTLAGFSSSPSVELALLSTNFRVVTTAIVDQTRFWHRGLRPGRYAVQARAGDEIDSVDIEVKPGEVTRVQLQNRRTGRLEGVVTEYGTKRPLGGMRCEAKLALAGPPVDPAMQGVSDETGHFSMRAPVGMVHLLCSPPDQSLSITGDDVEVAADAIAKVEVVAVRGKFGTVRGDAGFSLKPMTLPLQLARVDPAGAASSAGARDGDQLLAIDGEPVRGMLPLTAMYIVMNHRPGSTVTIDVSRAGAPLTFKIPIVAAK